MKTKILIGLGFVLLVVSSFAQNLNSNKPSREDRIRQLIDSQTFVFKAQTVFPLGQSSRQLTSDYDLRVSKDAIVSYLPYFGRAYSITPGSPGGLDFTSKQFDYRVKANKKGGWTIFIKPKDSQQARELTLTVFRNGSAMLQVSSNDKQNIGYSGYITEPFARR